ncbi:hypothetical protein HBI56_032450 [Parastagonospora nodorum]|uniref:DUF6594 domain-containing protein n=1 Tax=Phaeosphaeria nodorum (strain SN15 / ATCC MYA-4574 / FGSC 10173) TaxID=321614 RepID=A0A7U2EYI9_PHANO|nr:hypothetical protein HBH56_020180 [Parastagonospora nodorum]QRC95410.1 hypothetical protein JI435_031000 [Parastagonospora nodorum SN15]KAH3937265.1 hypothetical protein HBH54_014330 [Parastagonospora nodorum]KAH3944127.1 hypothetical protein HBH53_162490 [Parastagonospora nodorum]KAH3967527.1 hypothetical protein HBH51_138000 [Parastagonospora nodorum]
MTDRGSAFDGRQPTSRHRSLSPEDPRYRYENLSYSSGAHAGGPSRTRPRPSRTSSDVSNPPHAASPPYRDSSRASSTASKSTRNTLKKVLRRDSLHADASPRSPNGQYYHEGGSSGNVSRLEQIEEGKKSRRLRNEASSTVSSSVEPRTRRRRKGGSHASDSSQSHHRHRTPQHSNSPLTMSNPSVVSVATDIHPESSVSNSSSTTVTQRSQDDRSDDEDSESGPETYISEASEGPIELTTAEADSAQPNVFQYMQQVPTVEEYSDEENDQSASSAASSASSEGDSDHEGTQSSHTGSSQFVKDTPTTSPASTRMSEPGRRHQPRSNRTPKRPLYASSFVHGHGGREDEESEGSEEASEDESDEGEADHEPPQHHDHGHAPKSALRRIPPPTAPSPSSGHSDTRAKRLQQQEQELANHILQSPQPKKDFQFAGGPSPQPQPSMPLYSPNAYSGASPAAFEPTAGYQAEWPQFPPPLPIGYPTQSMLESPTASHALPLTVQPPMGVPGLQVQQHPPPFQQHPGQPPQYQAHVPASDITRTTAVGYELLANKLSETPKKTSKFLRKGGNVVPIYRKFEHLNHRVLLHLQDEVCEMEEELRYLDESINQISPRNETGHAFPASRRGDARYGSDLHYKRTELLGRIFQKLGQYNQALTTFNGLSKDLDPASVEDIQAYRAWIEKRTPVDNAETRFLDRKNDLLAISRRPSVGPMHGGQQQPPIVWLPLVLVLPILAFAIVPSLLGRLVVITLIGAAGLRQVTSTPELMSYMTIQEWSIAAAVYFGAMALLAGLVR